MVGSFWDKIERVARTGRAVERIVRDPVGVAKAALRVALEET